MIARQRLQPVSRRAGALAVLFILLLTVWSAVIRPTFGLVFGADDLADVREHIAALRRDEHQLPDLKSKLSDAQRRLRNDQMLWGPGSAAYMSAGMQMQLKRFVSAAGGTVRDTADLPWTSEHGFLHVKIRGDLVQSLPELYKTLTALERSAPALIVDDLTIQSLQSSGQVVEPQLAIALVLSAYQADGL